MDQKALIKSIAWRIISLITLAAVTLYYTGNIIQATWITGLNFIIFLVVYYYHERAWSKIEDIRYPKLVPLYKSITYIGILGTTITALISYTITTNTETTTAITTTYVALKYIIYIVNELIWP